MNVASVGIAPVAEKVKAGNNPLKVATMPGRSAAPQAKSLERMRRPETLIMRKVVEELGKATKLRPKETYLRFETHKATGTVIAKIMDSRTNEVIMEIPPEKILNIMIDLQALAGILLNRKG